MSTQIKNQEPLSPTINHNGKIYRFIGVRMTTNIPIQIGYVVRYINKPIHSYMKLVRDRWVICKVDENISLHAALGL